MTDALLTSIEGNRQWLDGGAMFGNVPKPMWEKWVQTDEQNRIRLACRAMLIQCRGLSILCEVGIGNFFEPKLRDRFGVEGEHAQLLTSLEEQGLTDKDIDIVILSHLHFDHAGGLLPSFEERAKGRGDLLFPNARYICGMKAWDRAKSPHSRDRASYIPELIDKLESSGRLVVLKKNYIDGILEDRLQFRFSDGHTPGQMHTVFRGTKQTVFFAGDLIPGVPWLHLPVTMGYDRFPEKLIEEKQAVLTEAIQDNTLIFYTHDIEHAASWVEKDEKGRFTAKNAMGRIEKLPI